ncbi:MAG TPA: LLM class flavin-dependent oxidoreductase [Candidatus Binataceae bacterium]|nr:LLM class flavin-dependent oxidoreductase [Candidatus Binataceae bacterium]
MKIGGFYEHQLPRPWTSESEHRLLKDALEQVELADRLGFDYVWATEHHFLEEYAHSSAPEIFLAACAARTRNVRLGHGIVQMPPYINQPARVAERIATLDLISDGRVDFGTGEGAAEIELGGFNVAQEEKRAQWMEGLQVVTRMLVEEPFAGFEGKYVRAPVRNVVPKPLQKPHPPLWLACSRRETILLAARLGIGALTFAFVSPEESRQWVHDYYETLEKECEPVGYAINPQIAMACPFLCDRNEKMAREVAHENHGFFMYGLGHYAFFGQHEPGKTNLWESYKNQAAKIVIDDPLASASQAQNCIGTPDQIRETLRVFEESGVDQVLFLSQAGKISHELLSSSIDLFGREVLPEIKERDYKRARDKAALVERLSEKAMKRKPKLEVPGGPPTIVRAAGHH